MPEIQQDLTDAQMAQVLRDHLAAGGVITLEIGEERNKFLTLDPSDNLWDVAGSA